MDAYTDLKRKKFDYLCLSSTMPREELQSIAKNTLYSDKTANGLTRMIIDYIKFIGGYAVRINTQGQYSEKLGKWIKGSTERGTADIMGCYNGRHFSIEVKIGYDTQSSDQLKICKRVEAAGGCYYVSRRFGNFYDWFNSEFITKN